MPGDPFRAAPIQRVAAVLRRAASTLAVCFIVALSLLTFPNAVPWMIAFWLLCHTVLVMRGRAGWVPLAACAAVLLAKRVPWTPGFTLLGPVALGAVAAGFVVRRRATAAWRRAWAAISVLALWAAWAVAAADWHFAARCNHAVVLKPEQPVVCLGDSLTSMGIRQGGYPERLAELITLPVVNLGEPGINTRQAAAMLPAVLRARPQVVVLELGGHDFLQGRSRTETRAGLDKIILACQEIGAEIVIMEITRGYMTDPFAGLERDLARQHGLELVPDTAIRCLLLSSPTLPPGMWTGGPFFTEDDGLHPNDLGNRLLARYVAEALERMYGPAIRRQDSFE
jgi:acyl-CoA thioesterase-1